MEKYKAFILILCISLGNCAVINKNSDFNRKTTEIEKKTSKQEDAIVNEQGQRDAVSTDPRTTETDLQIDDIAQLEGSVTDPYARQKRCSGKECIVRASIPIHLRVPRDTGNINQKMCEDCQKRHKCANDKPCNICNTWCKNLEKSKATVPATPKIKSRFATEEENEPKPRFIYTIGRIEPGKNMDLISKILGIEEKEDIEKIILLAKMKTNKVPKISLETRGSISDEERDLTSELNKELEKSLETKPHLTPKDIDEIVEKVLERIRSGELHKEIKDATVASRSGLSPDSKELDGKATVSSISDSTKKPSINKVFKTNARLSEFMDSLKNKRAKHPTDNAHTKVTQRLNEAMNNFKNKKIPKLPAYGKKHVVSKTAETNVDMETPKKETGKQSDNVIVGSRSSAVEPNKPSVDQAKIDEAKLRANEILQTLSQRISEAKEDEDLDKAKVILEKVKGMINNLNNEKSSDLPTHHETLKKIQENLDNINKNLNEMRANENPSVKTVALEPRVGSARTDNEIPDISERMKPKEVTEPVKTVSEKTGENVKKVAKELLSLPQFVIDKAHTALDSVDENNLIQGEKGSEAIPKPVGSDLVSSRMSQLRDKIHKIKSHELPKHKFKTPTIKGRSSIYNKPKIIKPEVKPIYDSLEKMKKSLKTEEKNMADKIKSRISDDSKLIKDDFKAYQKNKEDETINKSNTDNPLEALNKATQEKLNKFKSRQAEIAEKIKEKMSPKTSVLENIRNKLKKDNTLVDSDPITGLKKIPENIVPKEQVKQNTLEDSPPMDNRGNFDETDAEDLGKLGKIVPSEGSQIGHLKKPSSVFFLGNGVKLPLKMSHEKDGSVQLSVDMDKLCSCKNSTCPAKRSIPDAVATILEKEEELKSVLEPDGNYNISPKLKRNTDLLLKELEDAGFDFNESIVSNTQGEECSVPLNQNVFQNNKKSQESNLEKKYEQQEKNADIKSKEKTLEVKIENKINELEENKDNSKGHVLGSRSAVEETSNGDVGKLTFDYNEDVASPNQRSELDETHDQNLTSTEISKDDVLTSEEKKVLRMALEDTKKKTNEKEETVIVSDPPQSELEKGSKPILVDTLNGDEDNQKGHVEATEQVDAAKPEVIKSPTVSDILPDGIDRITSLVKDIGDVATNTEKPDALRSAKGSLKPKSQIEQITSILKNIGNLYKDNQVSLKNPLIVKHKDDKKELEDDIKKNSPTTLEDINENIDLEEAINNENNEEKPHRIVQRMAENYEKVLRNHKATGYLRNVNEKYDDVQSIEKKYKFAELLEKDLENKLEHLNNDVEKYDSKIEKLIQKGADELLKGNKKNEVVEKEVELASDILSWMKSLTIK